MSHGTESEFEETTIERLKALGWEHTHGTDLVRSNDEVVLPEVLREFLKSRYADLPAAAIDEAVKVFTRPEGVDTLRRNKAFHELLTRGYDKLRVDRPDGTFEIRHVYAIDWDRPERNTFQVVNQLTVSGHNDRRPDVVLYVNGFPIVLFELKNPYSEKPTVEDALNQIGHYTQQIPQLFEYNAVTVISDGMTTLHGTWTSTLEWYAPWKSIDGVEVEPNTTGSMKTLVEGMLTPERLLKYIRYFVLFEVAKEKIIKKSAKYHQFFAVQIAAERTLKAARTNDRRVGVIWHTTGSGKSLSMAFLVGMLRKTPELSNPTFVIQVDRTDLDQQLYDQFVAAKSLVGSVSHAGSTEELRKLLQTEGGEVIFTTIEKFRLRKRQGALEPDELDHPVLTERSNVIIIADEAHRTQYGFSDGYARHLADALPNAKRLGFTGTPVSFSGADTVSVFGEVIHTYDMKQSQDDKATVPIFYAPRQIKLHLSKADIDAALARIVADANVADADRRKSRWAALAKAAGAQERIDELSKDLLAHFLDRSQTLRGKAMIVCMTRENCVRLYDALRAIPGCPEIKVIMTGDLSEDPQEWNDAGHITTKPQRETIKKRMIDPDDPLQLVIVCDMWLTGTDIPCLHTLYVDKPMTGHNMIQAISRVNRVFSNKPHGLIVDYIGIGDDLREATAKYTKGGGRGTPAPDVSVSAKPVFMMQLAAIRSLLPAGKEFGRWRRMSGIEREDLRSLVYGTLTDSDELRQHFLDAESKLSASFLLVKHLDECRTFADEVMFMQMIRNGLLKVEPGTKSKQRQLDLAVRDLVDNHIESEGVFDIFVAAGLAKADLSILDDQFLQTFKDHPQENLRLKLLTKLLADEIRFRQQKNQARSRTFSEMLQDTLLKYHNRLIDAAAVVSAMLQIRKEMESEDKRAADLNLEADELAFYDALAENFGAVYEAGFLRDVVHRVVLTLKQNLKVDWTEPHRDSVKAAIRSAVRRALRHVDGIRDEDIEPIAARLLAQAESTFRDWPLAV